MSNQSVISQNQSLYEQDFNLWLEITINQIQNYQFNQIDWEHLLLELSDMGKSDKRQFISNFVILIAHLLKLKIQFDAPESMQASWYNSIDEHRDRIHQDLLENPSFKNFLDLAINTAYPRARNLAIKEGKRAAKTMRKPQENEYPTECPFTIDQLLDYDYYVN
ncbi:MAG TPA: DUF29 domain-containing protein [Allocoleopsis sp.]